MILKQIGITFLLLFASSGYAQQLHAVAQIAPELKRKANAVIREMQTTVDMREDDNVVMTVQKIVTILNKNGDDEARVVLFYDKNTIIKFAKGIISDEFGKPIHKFALNNFTDHSAVSSFSLFEDNRVKRFMPTVLSYPYTIAYEYEIRYKQNLIIPDWYASPGPDVSVAKNSYTFTCKTTDKIRIKTLNYSGKPEVQTQEKFISHTWAVKNLPAIKIEPFAPIIRNYLIQVKIAPETFNYYGHQGKYQNWQELGKWIYTELIKDRQTLSPSAVTAVQNLVKGIKDDKEKARKIYEYVQQKTRYISVQIGIGGNQPMQANEVHQLSYGDCKALVNYTQSLLKIVNIPSWYCIVNAGNFKKDMEPDFASMNQGNHIILCLPFENDTTWLECTNQDSPFGYLGDFTDDRTVLACTEDGGKILNTPTLSSHMNLQDRKAELMLDEDGHINGTVKTTFYGSQYDNYAYLAKEPLKEQLKLLKQTYDIDNINFGSFHLSHDKGHNPCAKEALDVNIKHYAPKTSKHMYLVLNIFNKKRNIPEVRNRIFPVLINRGYTDQDEITYTLPKDIVIELLPGSIEIKNNFGSYYSTVSKTGNKLIYKRKFILNDGIYPPDKYTDFAAFISTVSSHDQIKLVFNTGSTQK